jgi:hypothetical protein
MGTRQKVETTYAPPANDANAAEECVTCGAVVASPFCGECGEKRASDRSYSVWAFAREHVIEALASFDGRLIRTLKTLLRKPGELTASFMRGVRVPYLPPLQCFLLFNLAFFLWSSAAHMRVLDTTLAIHMHDMSYSDMATRYVNARLARTHEPLATFALRFDAVGSAQARSLVLVMVPLFTLVVALVTIRKRRPAVQHLVFGLHTYSFLFVSAPVILFGVAFPLILALRAMHVHIGGGGEDLIFSALLLAVVSWYIAVSLRRAYQFGTAASIVGAIVLAMTIGRIIQEYHRLLFFVALWSM